jgi:hypothetical protein
MGKKFQVKKNVEQSNHNNELRSSPEGCMEKMFLAITTIVSHTNNKL